MGQHLLSVLHGTRTPVSNVDDVKCHAKSKKCVLITHKMTKDIVVFFICYLVRPGWANRPLRSASAWRYNNLDRGLQSNVWQYKLKTF